MRRGSHDEDRGEERGRRRRETHCVGANLCAEVKCCGLLPTRFALSFSWNAASASMICSSRSCLCSSCDGEPFVCAYRAHLRARRRSGWWVKRKKGELWCEEEKRPSNNLSARVWTPRSPWQSLSSLPRRSLTSPSLSQARTPKSATSNPFPHLHPSRGLDFSSNQNKSLR